MYPLIYFSSVTSRYLKPNAVPSRGIAPKSKRKIKIFVKEVPVLAETNVPEHGYSVPWRMPRSRTICFVPGCTARAGNGIKLHRFPRDTLMLKKWTHSVKTKKPPSKYSKICSRHFTSVEYQPGNNNI